MKTNKDYIAGHQRDLDELIIRKEKLEFEIYDIDTEIAETNQFIRELEGENDNE